MLFAQQLPTASALRMMARLSPFGIRVVQEGHQDMISHSGFFGVVTTIQRPTPSIRVLAARIAGCGGRLIVVGDRKGPESFQLDGADFFALPDQRGLDLRFAAMAPEGHYSRKNIGYLIAMSRGACCIYETDDDNAPRKAWEARSELLRAREISCQGWSNIYRFFSQDRIWPRGFPLDRVSNSFDSPADDAGPLKDVRAPVQQGLVDDSPDVDAVWRLTMDRPVRFEDKMAVSLRPGTWSPFNSQSTWWWPRAYPLMYLPSYCSFRMTDIWRSFVAQRCLWELGLGVVFHGPEVVQERNQHNLMKDFADEIPGYVGNSEFVEVLGRLKLSNSMAHVHDNLVVCYDALIKAGFFPAKEMDLVDAWSHDVRFELQSRVDRAAPRIADGSGADGEDA